jgi:hypothetical protein
MIIVGVGAIIPSQEASVNLVTIGMQFSILGIALFIGPKKQC